jgi:uncharacterized protein (TIGR03067 family)
MKPLSFIVITGLMLLAIGHIPGQGQDKTKASPDPQKRDFGLVGVWRQETLAAQGQLPAKQPGKTFYMFFEDGEFIQRWGKEVLYGTYTTDAEAKPGKMDMKVVNSTVAPLKGETMLCIFEVDGDTLKLCRAGGGKDRPTEFETKPGSGRVLQTFKREKP